MNFDELCKTKELSTDDIKTIVAGALEKGVVYNVPDKFQEDVNKVNANAKNFFFEKLLIEYYAATDENARANILGTMFLFLFKRNY
jgi:hypothetical protein